MMRHLKLGFVLTAALLLMAVLPTVVAACGGLFCTTVPIDQNAERIIFTVDREARQVSAIIGINYVGAAEDFSWILPVPTVPEIDVAPQESLDFLEVTTAPRFNPPLNPCRNLYEYGGRGGGGGDFFVEQGSVGPFDFAILGSQDPNEVINWLRSNNYRITEEMEPLVALYVEEEFFFVAMKLTQNAEVGDIQPVVITYEAEKPSIPLRLTAVAAQPNMPVLTWIFADTRYEAENYANPVPDFTRFRGPHQVNGIGDFSASFFFGSSGVNSQYAQQQSAIQDEFNGLAFITEYAQPSANLTDPAASDPLIQQLMREYPYVTRLRAQLSPEQMTLDPVFAPVDDAVNVTNVIEVSEFVDPLAYWGCSTRTILNQATLNNLPEGRTYLPDLNLSLAHPPDWVLSTLSLDGGPLWVFAPEAVDAGTIAAFLNGEATPPMFVFTRVFYRGDEDAPHNMRTLGTVIGVSPDAETSYDAFSSLNSRINVRFDPYGREFYMESGIDFAILASQAQREANQAMFNAMLRYARSYQFFLHPDLQHTLFLDFQLQVAYPSGWVERTLPDGEIVIAPEDAANIADTPRIRMIPLEDAPFADLLQTHFGLSDAGIVGTPFEHDGRRGMVRFADRFLIEVSAPTETFAENEALLTLLMDTVKSSPV